MTAFHQMGHHSENLLSDGSLDALGGAILSPVNYSEAEVTAQVAAKREDERFATVFDPQLYYPRSQEGKLPTWSHFPNIAGSMDVASRAWWSNLTKSVVEVASRIEPTAACSPAWVPRTSSNQYFSELIDIGVEFCDRLSNTGIEPIQSLIVSLNDLTNPDRAFEIASIASGTKCSKIFLVFVTDVEPRRELSDPNALAGALRLVHELESAGISTIVGYCSTDVVLFKAAGATSCASGKFFNLRRFTESRFEEPAGGGKQLPYFVEDGLVALLRESDIARLIRTGWQFSDATLSNPSTEPILDIIKSGEGQAWLALSWRHYLHWFADVERRVGSVEGADELLLRGESNWTALNSLRPRVLMEETTNDGGWLRAWRRALAESGIG